MASIFRIIIIQCNIPPLLPTFILDPQSKQCYKVVTSLSYRMHIIEKAIVLLHINPLIFLSIRGFPSLSSIAAFIIVSY